MASAEPEQPHPAAEKEEEAETSIQTPLAISSEAPQNDNSLDTLTEEEERSDSPRSPKGREATAPMHEARGTVPAGTVGTSSAFPYSSPLGVLPLAPPQLKHSRSFPGSHSSRLVAGFSSTSGLRTENNIPDAEGSVSSEGSDRYYKGSFRFQQDSRESFEKNSSMEVGGGREGGGEGREGERGRGKYNTNIVREKPAAGLSSLKRSVSLGSSRHRVASSFAVDGTGEGGGGESGWERRELRERRRKSKARKEIAMGERSGDSVSGIGGDEDSERQNELEPGSGRVQQIAEGLLWIQKHPVLSAVIWMLGKALTPGMEDENGEEAAEEEPTAGKHSAAKNRDTECETDNSNRGGQAGDRDQSRDHRGGQTNRDDQKLRVHAEDNETSSAWKVGDGGYDSWDSPLRDESSDDAKEGDAIPPRLYRDRSKGRLSWSDEFGGCLAEYYEDERMRTVSDCSSVVAPELGSEPLKQNVVPAGGEAYKPVSRAYLSTPRAYKPRSYHLASNDESWETEGEEENDSDREPTEEPRKGPAGVRPEDAASPMGDIAFEGKGAGSNFSGDAETLGDDVEESGKNVLKRCGALAPDDPFYGNHRGTVRSQRQHGEEEEEEDNDDDDDPRKGPASVGATGYGERRKVDSAMSKTLKPKGHKYGGGLSNTLTTMRVPGVAGLGPASIGGSPGTWSPQWGWYVTMTPPQDLYPTPETPVPAASTTATSAQSPDVEGACKGRPPKP